MCTHASGPSVQTPALAGLPNLLQVSKSGPILYVRALRDRAAQHDLFHWQRILMAHGSTLSLLSVTPVDPALCSHLESYAGRYLCSANSQVTHILINGR